MRTLLTLAVVLFSTIAQSSASSPLLLEQLPALRAGVTLAEWRRAHPNDVVEFLNEAQRGEWCARATRQIGAPVARTLSVFFYLPQFDADTPPPFDRTPDEVRANCRAGLAQVAVTDTSLAAQHQRALSAALGASTTTDAMVPDLGALRSAAFWRAGELAVLFGVTRPLPVGVPGRSNATAPVLIAVAAHERIGNPLHARALLPLERDTAIFQSNRSRFAARLNEAIARSGHPAERQRVAESFVGRWAARPGSPPQLSSTDAQQFLNLIVDWMTTTKTLNGEGRAASLLAADGLLEVARSLWSDASATSARKTLTSLGANLFVFPFGGGDYGSRHAWLREAARLTPEGRSRELILLEQMERGFELSEVCADQKSVGFRAVIREGQMYLDAHPDTGIAGEIHLMMADAWADIVALASGSAYDESESKQYVPERANARLQAIREYRLAWANDALLDYKRSSWETAMNLLANFPPRRTSFYCVYD